MPTISSRAKYIFEIIFQEHLGIPYSITSDEKEFEEYPHEKLNYSSKRINNSFFIQCVNLLFENNITNQKIPVGEVESHKVLFPQSDCDLGFDIFSASFYLISRYEEYLPFTPDSFGRFKAIDSLAYRNDFLQIPVVNNWIFILKKALHNKFPSINFQSLNYKAILTYDIDVAYKFRGRGFVRSLGSAMKDVAGLEIMEIFSRIKTLLKIKKDPWDVYDQLKETILRNELNSVFFFLMADKSERDRNLNYRSPLMKKLVNKTQQFSDIGIHPSFTTSTFPEKILLEKNRLEALCDKKITKSRQHYLKFVLPDTYNSLYTSGITEDFSMGFPEMPGFRAGICSPFNFYDLKKERVIDIKIFPVTYMDGSLINDPSITNAEEALQKILFLLTEVKKVGGTFISLWHNHTISETPTYKSWKLVHDKMIAQLR